MSLSAEDWSRKSRLRVLLEDLAEIEDPRDVRRIYHPQPDVLLLVVCGSMANCDDAENVTARGAARLHFLHRFLPYEHGAPGECWLTILTNRINPALFSRTFSDWMRATWPERGDLVAIDGKTSRRSHDRSAGPSTSSRPSPPRAIWCSARKPCRNCAEKTGAYLGSLSCTHPFFRGNITCLE